MLAAIDRFAAAGLDGVEVFYPTHDEEQTRTLYEAAHARAGCSPRAPPTSTGPQHEKFNRFGAFELYGLEPGLGPIGR